MNQKFVIIFCIMMKKLMLTAIATGFFISASYADTYVKNDLRTKFLNNQAIIYEINMRTFNADDKNGNGIIEFDKGETSGNFINAVSRLDELKSYGINAIHLMPINPVGRVDAIGTVGSLYAMNEIAAIDVNLTDKKSALTPKEQLNFFISECHKRGIRVFVDIPACGSAEMALNHPEMFVKDKNGKAQIPVDWTDVRLFKTVEKDGSLNKKLFDEHKKYVDMLIEAGADGIRADVAPIKPKSFWSELIKYAREKDSEFMFLAETAEAWAPPKVPSPTANYVKLLEAGFDGYYGNCLNYLNFQSQKDFEFVFKHINKLAKKGIKKAIIGCFDTHDLESAYITSKDYAETIMYMNATLPLNPYYVDGFQSGDKYDYLYSGKKAAKTYTDNDTYYTHKNKIDIFNYSRKPAGSLPEMQKKLQETISLRNNLGKLVTEGSFDFIKTTDNDVYAYKRTFNGESLIVVINSNHKVAKNVEVKNLKGINLNKYQILSDNDSLVNVKDNKMTVTLRPDKCIVLKLKTVNK